MRKSLLYRNTPINYISTGLLAVIAGGIRYFLTFFEPVKLTNYEFLFGFLSIKAVPIEIDAIVVSGLFLLLALISNVINNHFSIVEAAFQRPAFIMICFSALILSTYGTVPALLSLFLVLAALARIFPIFRKTKATSNLLDAGLLISLASMTCYYAIFFLLLIVIAMLYLQSGNRKEYFALCLGLIAPYLFLFFILFFFDLTPVFVKSYLSHRPFNPDINKYTVNNMIVSASPLFLMLLAIIYHSVASGFKKVITRRYQSILLYFAAISAIIMVTPIYTPAVAVFLLFPLSISLSQIFVSTRSAWLRYFIWFCYLANIVGLLIFRFLDVYHG